MPVSDDAPPATIGPCQFGNFLLLPKQRVLLKHGLPVDLGSRALDILIYLIERPGEVVDKDQLMTAVWGRQAVEPNNLTVQLSALRRALDVDENGTPFILTLPRRGYVFSAPITRPAPEPPPAAGRANPRTLGAPATSFVGRSHEIAQLLDQMETHRLVTITGMGGVGKSRLMTRLAGTIAQDSTDRMFQVELSTVARAGDVAEAIATGIGAGLTDATPVQAILGTLRNRRAILMIDNAEHVVRAVSALLHTILTECPDISMLVTSRVSLGVPGEKVFRLQPLPLPPAGGQLSAEEALCYDAVRLFVERATMAVPDFRMEQAKPAVIAEICRRLDGIALAIEMAVPRLQVLTAEQFLQRLDHRFNLLASGSHDVSRRQRSLHAMLEWSWELLRPEEQQQLLHLAIFSGTASLSGIVAMQPDARDGEWAVLDDLTELVRASLVIAEPTGAQPRYRLLETTRAFALQRMSPDVSRALRDRHLSIMVAEFEAAEASWSAAPSPAWLDQYGPDADNLRSALNWAFGPGDQTELGLRLAAVSYPLWWELPSLPLRESRYWFDIAVARMTPDTPASIQARLWLGHSWRDVQIGDGENYAAAEKAVALFRPLADPVGLGAALWRAGCAMLLFETLPAAASLLQQAEAVLRTCAPTKWLALALIRHADVLAQLDDFAAAAALYAEARTISAATKFWLARMVGGSSEAELLLRSGYPDEALRRLQALHQDLPRGHRTPLVSILATHLGNAGQTEAAMDAIREVLEEAPSTGLLVALARGLETLAMVEAEAGQVEWAARMLGFVLTVHPASRRRTGGRLGVYTRLNAALRASLGPDAIAALIAEGAAWPEAMALSVATDCMRLHGGGAAARLWSQ